MLTDIARTNEDNVICSLLFFCCSLIMNGGAVQIYLSHGDDNVNGNNGEFDRM